MSVDGSLLERIAAAIARVRLDAVVVGNAASELHGAPVSTEDVDLLVRDTSLNRQKIERLVDELDGIGPVPISELHDGQRIFLPEIHIDLLFNKMKAVSFNAAKAHSERIVIGRYTLTVAALRDVIKSKAAANRLKDQAVLPILRATLATIEARRK